MSGRPEFRNRRANLAAVRRVLQAKGCGALDSRSKVALRAAAADGVWTKQKLFDKGYAEDNKCEKCGLPDTVFHRCWGCQYEVVVEVRRACA